LGIRTAYERIIARVARRHAPLALTSEAAMRAGGGGGRWPPPHFAPPMVGPPRLPAVARIHAAARRHASSAAPPRAAALTLVHKTRAFVPRALPDAPGGGDDPRTAAFWTSLLDSAQTRLCQEPVRAYSHPTASETGTRDADGPRTRIVGTSARLASSMDTHVTWQSMALDHIRAPTSSSPHFSMSPSAPRPRASSSPGTRPPRPTRTPSSSSSFPPFACAPEPS
jgi:hypothetical protein